MRSVLAIIHYLQENGQKPVDVTIGRNGQQFHYTMIPQQVADNGQTGYRLGFGISGPMKVQKLSFSKALSVSLQEKQAVLAADRRTGAEDDPA